MVDPVWISAETPGLGGEIDNPTWKAQWVDKKIYDKDGSVQLHVVKGVADKSSPQAVYQVDGLSGATLTVNGVTDLVQYWLGDDGFKKALERLQAEGA